MKTWSWILLLIAVVFCCTFERTQSLELVLPVVNCENAKADVVFVLDSSGSVRSWNFKKMLDFIRGIIQRFNVGIDYMRVGLVRFNTQVIPEFQLNQFTHIENLLERLEAVEYTTGTTNMAGALKYVWKNSYSTENGGRPDARRIAIIISDGRSDNRVWTTNEAVKCKERNVTLFALGIGGKVDRDELQDIGSDPDSKHVIFYDDFDSLNGTQIMIADSVCTYSRPKVVQVVVPVVPVKGLDGGAIAGIVFGVLILICLILAYPAYVLYKRKMYGDDKKKKTKPKRPKTGAHKKGHKKGHRHRGKSGHHHHRRRPASRTSRGSDHSSHGGYPNSHTHTPLRPGTSSLSRQSSYGSFEPDPRPNYSRHMAEDNIPLRPISRSSDSSGSTFGRYNPISQEGSRRSSVIDGPPVGGPGSRALPPGLERAISLMRRQKTLTQHPAPGQMPPPPPGLGGRQGTMMAPPMGLGARQGTMVAPTPGSFMLRERTMAAPGPTAPTAMIRGPPPPGVFRRDGTIIGPPPPPNMMRREGTTVGPPPGALRREGTGMGLPGPPPVGMKREASAMGPPSTAMKRERTTAGPGVNRHHQSIPEEGDNTKDENQARIKAPKIEIHAPPVPPVAGPPGDVINPPDQGLSARLPGGRGSKLPPLKSSSLPEEGAVDPNKLANRLLNLQDPVPKVVLQGQGGFPDISEDQV